MYIRNGQVHTSETREALGWNTGRDGMKRLMEEAAARHAKAVYYLMSAGIRVRGDGNLKPKDSGF